MRFQFYFFLNAAPQDDRVLVFADTSILDTCYYVTKDVQACLRDGVAPRNRKPSRMCARWSSFTTSCKFARRRGSFFIVSDISINDRFLNWLSVTSDTSRISFFTVVFRLFERVESLGLLNDQFGHSGRWAFAWRGVLGLCTIIVIIENAECRKCKPAYWIK